MIGPVSAGGGGGVKKYADSSQSGSGMRSNENPVADPHAINRAVIAWCKSCAIPTAFPVDGFSLPTVRPDGQVTSREVRPGGTSGVARAEPLSLI